MAGRGLFNTVSRIAKGIFLAVDPVVLDGETFPLRLSAAGYLFTTLAPVPPVPGAFIFTKPAPQTPLGYQQLVGAGLLTPAIPATAIYLFFQVENNDARFRDDGVAPTATVGQPALIGQAFQLAETTASLGAVRFIAQAGSTTVNILYYS